MDRALLVIISILLINKSQVDYVMVCLILIAIIAETMILYFRRKKAVVIIAVAFVTLSLLIPELVAFYPLFVYECALVEMYPVMPIQLLIVVFTYLERFDYSIVSRNLCAMIIIMVVGAVWGMRTGKNNRLSRRIHELQDEESFIMQKNRQSREELMLRQNSEIHAATLAERNRIAREIHDHVGHMLSRSILQLGAILAVNKDEKLKGPLGELKNSLDTAMNNIRESVHDLKDESLDLEYMIKDIIGQYEKLEINLDYDMSVYLSKELKYCLMAIVKESLTNTVKHSDSTKVDIVMREHPALYQVLIEDNGADSKTAIKRIKENVGKTGIGLDNIRERVNAFGGNVRFTGDNGFKIFISIPKKQEG